VQGRCFDINEFRRPQKDHLKPCMLENVSNTKIYLKYKPQAMKYLSSLISKVLVY